MANDKTCSALIITCSDFRFKFAERALAESAGIVDDYDLIARPGAIRPLVAPRSDAARETLEEEIALLRGLHGFRRIIMVNHEDCGAYADIASPKTEVAVQTAHLRAAKALLEGRFEGLRAEGYLLNMTGRARALTTES